MILQRLSLGAAAVACALAPALSAVAQEEARAPLQHEVRNGDTLSGLAAEYLDNPGMWPELAKANGISRPNRLQPGSIVAIPDDLLRKRPGGALVVHVSGQVSYLGRGAAPVPLASGMRLMAGDAISTGEGGFATLQMADGSVVRVVGGSELRLDKASFRLSTKRAQTELALGKGRVESQVAPQKPTRSEFQVSTPLMAAGVRGTDFGVSIPEENRAVSDVLTGAVALRVKGSGAVSAVAAGQGGAVAAGDKKASVVPLLPPPDLGGIQALQQRPIIDFSFPALAGAAFYRAFIWPAGTDEAVAGNVLSRMPRIHFDGLDDGDYVVRVRAVDPRGVEGRPTMHALKLKARPLPPVTMAPVDGGSVEGEVQLGWTEVTGAQGYRVQLAKDKGFTDLMLDDATVTGSTRAVGTLPTGPYYWRVATRALDKNGNPDLGPYGDPRQFTARKPLGAPGAKQDGDTVVLVWDGEPGQTYLVQLASDPAFAVIVRQVETNQRQLALEALPGGDYYLRIQATDPDGYVRSFTPPQKFGVHNYVHAGTGGILTDGSGKEIQSQ